MAATKRNAMLIEEAREKIKTTQLINRLQDHALGDVDMSQTQVRAVEILLKKRVPDLATVAVAGDHDDGPVQLAGYKESLDAKLGGMPVGGAAPVAEREPD